jgi:hypothetical protein
MIWYCGSLKGYINLDLYLLQFVSYYTISVSYEVVRVRKFVILEKPVNDIKKIMLYEVSDGVYLFIYNVIDDVP